MCCALQVILQLCRQVRFVEQLVETEELQCVIIALTSLWDQCSSSWRRLVSRVLRAVSAAQVPSTVSALQGQLSSPYTHTPRQSNTCTQMHRHTQAWRIRPCFIVRAECVLAEFFKRPHIFTCSVFGH